MITCVPAERVMVEKDAPEPMLPSMLDSQARLAVTSPSSVSPALPLKSMGLPWAKLAPSAGAVISAVGVELPATSLTTANWSGMLPSISLK